MAILAQFIQQIKAKCGQNTDTENIYQSKKYGQKYNLPNRT
jgi:hypothetical protein